MEKLRQTVFKGVKKGRPATPPTGRRGTGQLADRAGRPQADIAERLLFSVRDEAAWWDALHARFMPSASSGKGIGAVGQGAGEFLAVGNRLLSANL